MEESGGDRDDAEDDNQEGKPHASHSSENLIGGNLDENVKDVEDCKAIETECQYLSSERFALVGGDIRVIELIA